MYSKNSILNKGLKKIYDDPNLDHNYSGHSVSLWKNFFMTSLNQPILTPEEEKELVLSYKNENNVKAYNKLVLTHLRLVIKIALRYSKQSSIPLFDLLQQGNLGVLTALHKFDPKKKVRFSTYAMIWIRAYILEYLKTNHSPMQIINSRTDQKFFYALNKTKADLHQNGQNPNDYNLLSKILQADKEDIQELDIKLNRKVVSLDQLRTPDSEDTLLNTIHDHHVNIEQEAIQKDLHNRLIKMMDHFSNQLNNKHKLIWEKRLRNEQPVSLRNIGKQLNISGERVRQIENAIKEKFKSYFKANNDVSLNDYLN